MGSSNGETQDFRRGARFFVGENSCPPLPGYAPEVTVELSRPTVQHVTHVGYVIYFWMQQTRYCPVEQHLFAKKKKKIQIRLAKASRRNYKCVAKKKYCSVIRDTENMLVILSEIWSY